MGLAENGHVIELATAALERARTEGDHASIAGALYILGVAAIELRDEQAASRLAEALARFHALGYQAMAGFTVNQQGRLALRSDPLDLEEAMSCFEKARRLMEQAGHDLGLASILLNLGEVTYARGDIDRANTLFRESVVKHVGLNNLWGVARSFEHLAVSLGAGRQPKLAVRLCAAAARVREETGIRGKRPSELEMRRFVGDLSNSAWREIVCDCLAGGLVIAINESGRRGPGGRCRAAWRRGGGPCSFRGHPARTGRTPPRCSWQDGCSDWRHLVHQSEDRR